VFAYGADAGYASVTVKSMIASHKTLQKLIFSLRDMPAMNSNEKVKKRIVYAMSSPSDLGTARHSRISRTGHCTFLCWIAGAL
jgi:type VI protein secretion system component VasF